MELKFVAAKKPVAVDVVTQRRQRLIRRIDQQIRVRTSVVAARDARSF